MSFFKLLIKNTLSSHRNHREIHKAIAHAIMSNQDLYDSQDKIITGMLEQSINRLKELDFFKNIPQKQLVQGAKKFFSVLRK